MVPFQAGQTHLPEPLQRRLHVRRQRRPVRLPLAAPWGQTALTRDERTRWYMGDKSVRAWMPTVGQHPGRPVHLHQRLDHPPHVVPVATLPHRRGGARDDLLHLGLGAALGDAVDDGQEGRVHGGVQLALLLAVADRVGWGGRDGGDVGDLETGGETEAEEGVAG